MVDSMSMKVASMTLVLLFCDFYNDMCIFDLYWYNVDGCKETLQRILPESFRADSMSPSFKHLRSSLHIELGQALTL